MRVTLDEVSMHCNCTMESNIVREPRRRHCKDKLVCYNRLWPLAFALAFFPASVAAPLGFPFFLVTTCEVPINCISLGKSMYIVYHGYTTTVLQRIPKTKSVFYDLPFLTMMLIDARCTTRGGGDHNNDNKSQT